MTSVAFILFVLTSTIIGFILLSSFMYLLKSTNEDRLLRGTMNEYQRLQEEYAPLQQRQSWSDHKGNDRETRAQVGASYAYDQRTFRQQIGLNRRIKQVEGR